VTPDYRSAPIDPVSTENLATQNLRFATVDTDDVPLFTAWLQAEVRGFHDSTVKDDGIAPRLANNAHRRVSGVWDDSGADPITPVATAASWPADLTVPGQTSIPAWAISAITVSPTHRRRGIARNLLEAELRTAASLGLAVAMLTVSEATIYSRFGFAPAAMVATWTFATQRAKWIGPKAPGRIQFVSNEQMRETDGPPLLERVRLSRPGQVQFDGGLWTRLFGVLDEKGGRDLRTVRYDDENGVPQGFAVYKLIENPSNFTTSLEVTYLIAASDDAYSGLWRYLLEIDLVDTVKAELRPIDEPVLWQIADARAARKTDEGDHLWTRILDVKAALEARSYSAQGDFLIEVSDDLGHADGMYTVVVDAVGGANVTKLDDGIPAIGKFHHLRLSVNELGALYLGGVSAVTLARAGRIVELSVGAAEALDISFRSPIVPSLNIWF
jgi:predicted acetyltransferase